MKDFGKVLTAMVTPMNEDFSINYSEAAKLATYLADHGSDGLVVAGSTGEAATMTKEEKLKLYSTVLDAVGDRATVIAGTGSNDTRASIDMTQAAEKAGVHAALLVGPYYNKPTQEGYYQHFSTIAHETNLPLVVYNVPGRTASNILPATIVRLAAIDNIVAVKESSGNLDQVSEIIRTKPENFSVYSGDDSLTLPMLAVGASGVVSVASHVAGLLIHQMITSFFAHDIIKARDLHLKLMPIFKTLFITTNPIPVKMAVNLLGIKAGAPRLPLVAATAAETEKIKQAMQELGVL